MARTPRAHLRMTARRARQSYPASHNDELSGVPQLVARTHAP
jgi:hypothetical protein